MEIGFVITSVLWSICGIIGIIEVLIYKRNRKRVERGETVTHFQESHVYRIHYKVERIISRACNLCCILWWIFLILRILKK